MALALFLVKGIATYGHSVIMARIGNAILAKNQRQLFGKLMQESMAFFAPRHSSEFLARLSSTGASAVTQALNLVINSVGRDLMSLIALVVVMVTQDPVMSLFCLVIVPPAAYILRSLVKRVRGLARNQFIGTTDILETMQELLQGLRTVKAFTLEAAMQRRIDDNVTAVQRNAEHKMARVSNRSSPLMEMLAGVAISLALVYSGYRDG